MALLRHSFLTLAVLLGTAGVSAQTIIQVGPLTTSHRLQWDLGAPDQATAERYEPRVRVDAIATFLALPGTRCITMAPQQFTCDAAFIDPLVTMLNTTGSHTITLRMYDPVTMMEGTDSLPARIVMPAPCVDGTTTYQLGAVFGQRNQFSTLSQATRVAALRRAGFRVESYRAQYKDPTTPTSADGGYWWILATCTGVPQ